MIDILKRLEIPQIGFPSTSICILLTLIQQCNPKASVYLLPKFLWWRRAFAILLVISQVLKVRGERQQLRVQSRPRACFQRHYLRLELSHVKTWIFSKVQIGKPNTVRRSDYKGVSHVSIKSEHVKDLTIKMWSITEATLRELRRRPSNSPTNKIKCWNFVL